MADAVLDDSFGQQHKELFRKVTRGDYIENIINLMSTDLFITSSTSGRTLLHVAVIAGNVENVKILMKKGREKLLLMQDKDGDTALSLVARYTGNTDMAKCMVETKNGPRESLLEMQNKENIIPILMAAANGHKELTSYLYSQTTYTSKVFHGTDSQYRILLLSLCITAEIFDVALKLLKRYEELPKESLSLYKFSVPKLLRESLSLPNKILELDSNQQPLPDKFSALVALAKMPLAFPSGNQFSRREQLIYNILRVENEFRDNYGIPDIANIVQKLKDASAYEGMLHGAQHGIIEFINAMRKANLELLSAVDSCHRGIFSYAVLHPQLGPSSDRDTRSGAALQMQREIQWFKAVEKVVHPKFKEAKNVDGKKPHEIFTENHDELVKLGEKWAKDTATSFTIVGTLITTIMFAAAFTVPGGNDQDTGLPIFLHDNIFTTFLIADAFSLFTSAASVLIFIGILTSRYAEKDFLRSLPWKLLFGLWFLFLSVCSMIVAFCASITMILKGYRTYKWFIVGPTMSLGSIPIMVLVVSQLRLMYEILHSTRKNPISSIRN
ncbi:ankyrin repeat-containing protein [Trifolium pratense]|uniref:Ankyrin repeat-containing protein n=1 Tax=Trifolium pratense TaxID=57577 RepID=A0A2K3MXU6_TRIPR|nr:ankyrin repeat-containing protein [Trifolium pratense]